MKQQWASSPAGGVDSGRGIRRGGAGGPRAAPAALALALALALGAGPLAGCAPLVVGGAAATGMLVAVDRRTAGTQLDDEAIALKAASRIREALGERARVNVHSYNRQVLLTGEVPSEADRARAERLAAQVDNVRAVVNELAVMPPATLSQRSSDALVSGRVKAAIVDNKALSIHAFDVVTERGTVYLMGRVTQLEAETVTQVVRQVQGVQRVVRIFEIISEAELARLQPKPAPQSAPTAGN